MISARYSQQDGISLLETLVALFLIAMLTTSGAVLLTQAVRASYAVETKAASYDEIRLAHATLRDDLAALTRRAVQPQGEPAPARVFEGFSGQPETRLFSFVRNGWTNPGGLLPRSDLQRLEYRLEDASLIRRSWSHVDTVPGTPHVDEVILSGVERIEARFGREQVWLPEWVVETGSELELPDKVELTVYFTPEDRLRLVFLTGALP